MLIPCWRPYANLSSRQDGSVLLDLVLTNTAPAESRSGGRGLLDVKPQLQGFSQHIGEIQIRTFCHRVQPRRDRQRLLHSLVVVELAVLNRVAADKRHQRVSVSGNVLQIRRGGIASPSSSMS